MNRIGFLFLFLSCGTMLSFSANGDMILCNQGKSGYSIVLSSHAPSPERHAAKELQRFLQEISGAMLPIIDDSAALPSRAILLGENRHLETIGVDIDFKSLGKEGYVLRTKGDYLVIAGGKPRGTLYGIYGLLEDRLGCRWFTPDLSRIPKKETLSISSLDETIVPVLEYRDPFYSDVFEGDWVLRNRMNSSHAIGVEEKGGKVRFGNKAFVHTFYKLVEPEKYFDEHPEYFSEIDGKRRREGGQLCLTNPDVVQIAVKKLKRWIREDPEATIFSVSQNDWYGNCQCASCRAIDEREGSPAGSLLHFVNKVAEEVEKEFPDVIIETLAYQYTRKPPKTIRPRKNVVVRLCSIECCFCHPLETDPEGNNVSFREDIRGWNSLTDRLYVWDYVTNFPHYVQPHPNLRVLQPNIRFFVKNGVKGIFEQGNYSPGKHGEMSLLRSWLLAKFLWNPDYDYETAMREFCEAYYGPAAPLIREYIELMHDRVLETKTHMTIWMPPTSRHLDEETIKKAEDILNRAEKLVADNPTYQLRVREAHLPLQYVQIVTGRNVGDVSFILKDDSFGPDPNHRRFEIVRKFKETAIALGMSHISEGRTMESFLSEIDQKPASYRALKMENAASIFHVVPELGGKIPSWKLKSLDHDVLCFPEGWREDCVIKRRKTDSDSKYTATVQGNKILLHSETKDDFFIEKEYSLDHSEAVLNVKTRIVKTGNQKGNLPGVHTQSWWNLGAPDELYLWLGDAEKSSLFSLGGLPDDRKSRFSFSSADKGSKWLLWNQSKRIGILAGTPEQETSLEFLFDPKNKRARIGESTENSGRNEFLRQYEIMTKDPVKIIPGYPRKAEPLERREPEIWEPGPDDLQLHREGELSRILRDETAPKGWCAWMPGHTTEWAVQWHFDHELLDPEKEYQAFVTVKIGKKGEQGDAFTAGAWDTNQGRSMGDIRIAAKDVKGGEWVRFTLTKFKPGESQYLWIAPTANPDNVAEIRIAGFILERVDR
ncbi:DUF4838 domain-containing protein [Candidatus Sumerlaeota bacterium]|nr:DUF4838 domain-containing protein [Candidatus Sumerlaeota bacterium]